MVALICARSTALTVTSPPATTGVSTIAATVSLGSAPPNAADALGSSISASIAFSRMFSGTQPTELKASEML